MVTNRLQMKAFDIICSRNKVHLHVLVLGLLNGYFSGPEVAGDVDVRVFVLLHFLPEDASFA